MRHTLRAFGKTLIVLFCIWQFTMVATYPLPRRKGVHPAVYWLTSNVRTKVRPYALITSQWQNWNLFAPDPLRRVLHFVIEIQQEDGEWITLTTVDPQTVGWWRKATELKNIRRLDGDKMVPLRERYLRDFCTTEKLNYGAHLRLKRWYYVIPHNITPKGFKWWKDWKPTWYEKLGEDIYCLPQNT